MHQQQASYLETMRVEGGIDPADYALHLTRRARGLPLWFSLATYGTDAYRDAVEQVLTNARAAADVVRHHPQLGLVVEPELGVVLFRRHGWGEAEYLDWSRRLLDAGTVFVLPTRWHGETVARFVFLHPHTGVDIFQAAISAME